MWFVCGMLSSGVFVDVGNRIGAEGLKHLSAGLVYVKQLNSLDLQPV
jgi:hypothetical protein